MAQSITMSSGSPVIGSPITFDILSDAKVGNISFHLVKLIVHAGLNDPTNQQADTEYQHIQMSTPVTTEEGKSERVTIDISSALRAVADKYVYSAEPPMFASELSTYPTVKWNVEVYDEWMREGEVYQSEHKFYPTSDSYIESLFGAYTEAERLNSVNGFRTTQFFSRKPLSSPEIVAVGETVLLPKPFTTKVYVNDVMVGTTSVEKQIVSQGVQAFSFPYMDGETVKHFPLHRHTIYALPQDNSGDRYQIRFVNGMGCLESFSCKCLRSASNETEMTQYIRARQETFGTTSGSIYKKLPKGEKWQMQTGPLDEDWRAWFAHEVFMTPCAWILIGTLWVPCHLIAEDKVTLLDRSKTELSSLSFTIVLDIDGSPVASL